jgi:hypothetical protein
MSGGGEIWRGKGWLDGHRAVWVRGVHVLLQVNTDRLH